MSNVEILIAIAVFLLAGLLLFLGIRQFMERGIPLNNAYLYASEQERKTMDKKPHYRQSAIVFCLTSFVFVIIGFSIVMQNYELELLEIPLVVCIVVYAIVSTVRISLKSKE